MMASIARLSTRSPMKPSETLLVGLTSPSHANRYALKVLVHCGDDFRPWETDMKNRVVGSATRYKSLTHDGLDKVDVPMSPLRLTITCWEKSLLEH